LAVQADPITSTRTATLSHARRSIRRFERAGRPCGYLVGVGSVRKRRRYLIRQRCHASSFAAGCDGGQVQVHVAVR
jgi:hypothetical protein